MCTKNKQIHGNFAVCSNIHNRQWILNESSVIFTQSTQCMEDIQLTNIQKFQNLETSINIYCLNNKVICVNGERGGSDEGRELKGEESLIDLGEGN